MDRQRFPGSFRDGDVVTRSLKGGRRSNIRSAYRSLVSRRKHQAIALADARLEKQIDKLQVKSKDLNRIQSSYLKHVEFGSFALGRDAEPGVMIVRS